MLESMSMECPIITTDIGGHSEAVIPNVTGEVVPIDDIDALTNILTKMLLDTSTLQKMGLQAREKVINMFSLNCMLDETEKIIFDVSEKNSR